MAYGLPILIMHWHYVDVARAKVLFDDSRLHGVEGNVSVHVRCDSDHVLPISSTDPLDECAEEMPGQHFFQVSLKNGISSVCEVDWFWPYVAVHSYLVIVGITMAAAYA